MLTFLQSLNRHLVFAIPTMMVAGFACGWLWHWPWLKQLILPFTILMVYPMMVTLKIRQVFSGGDVKAQLLTQALNFTLIPLFAYLLGRIFFSSQPAMALGLLLASLVPTSGMTISWTGFARGNLAAAVKMTVIGLILGSLATPLYVQGLLGASIPVDLQQVFKQIVMVVFVPMAAGYATQRILVARFGQKNFQENLAPKFPGLSTLGVLGIVFIAMALKAPGIASRPGDLLMIFVPLVILYAGNFLLSTVVGKTLLPRGDAIALVYGTVMRNLSIALALSMSAFGAAGADAALVISLAYIIQVQSAAWYVKFTARLFGPAPEAISR